MRLTWSTPRTPNSSTTSPYIQRGKAAPVGTFHLASANHWVASVAFKAALPLPLPPPAPDPLAPAAEAAAAAEAGALLSTIIPCSVSATSAAICSSGTGERERAGVSVLQCSWSASHLQQQPEGEHARVAAAAGLGCHHASHHAAAQRHAPRQGLARRRRAHCGGLLLPGHAVGQLPRRQRLQGGEGGLVVDSCRGDSELRACKGRGRV
jgi:hypothetical protein